jgi:hypothetical protein
MDEPRTSVRQDDITRLRGMVAAFNACVLAVALFSSQEDARQEYVTTTVAVGSAFRRFRGKH